MKLKPPLSLLALLCAILSGVLVALAFEPFNLSLFIWLGLVPLYFAIWQLLPKLKQKRRWIHSFGLGWLAGVTFFLINLNWISTVSGLGAIALALFLGLYWGLFGLLAYHLARPDQLLKFADLKAQTPKLSKIEFKQRNILLSAHIIGLASITGFAWCVTEWLRATLFTGFSWNGLAVGINQPAIEQAASIVGASGLSFVPVFLSSCLYMTFIKLLEAHKNHVRITRWEFGVSLGLFSLLASYGAISMTNHNYQEQIETSVLILQPNISQEDKWLGVQEPKKSFEIYRSYEELIQQAHQEWQAQQQKKLTTALESGKTEFSLSLKQADLVIMPESTWLTPMYYEANEQGDNDYLVSWNNEAFLSELHKLDYSNLIIGAAEVEYIDPANQSNSSQTDKNPNYYNSLFLHQADKNHWQSYRKEHLVIFGEYVPLVDKYPWIAKPFEWATGVPFGGNMDRGSAQAPIMLDLVGQDTQDIPNQQLHLIPLICFEDTVSHLIRPSIIQNKLLHPQLLVNITNDGWFKTSAAAKQHFANARMRCIEYARPMLRSANTGVSGVISAIGTVQPQQVIQDATGNTFTQGSLHTTVSIAKNPTTTIYALLGNWWIYLGIIVIIGCMAYRIIIALRNKFPS